jgi:hypothetical protein
MIIETIAPKRSARSYDQPRQAFGNDVGSVETGLYLAATSIPKPNECCRLKRPPTPLAHYGTDGTDWRVG